MMCFKHLLPYAILLPVPSASPIFILIFAFQVFYTVKPCGYCLALMAILFISSSPSSPFTSRSPTSSSEPSTATPPDEAGLDLVAPTRNTWFDFNHGYIFDPVIHAFSPNATAIATLPDHEHDQDQLHLQASSSQEGHSGYRKKRAKSVPQGYLDLRYKGLGFVLDLGWRRTEEGTRWEMEDRRISRGVLDQRNRDEKAAMESVRETEAGAGAASEKDEDKNANGLLGSRESWKDRILDLVRGKSTNGMLGDW